MYLKKLQRKKKDGSEEATPSSRTLTELVGVPRSAVSNEAHPLAAVSELFADDPLWPEYLQAIKQFREEDDALENQAE